MGDTTFIDKDKEASIKGDDFVSRLILVFNQFLILIITFNFRIKCQISNIGL